MSALLLSLLVALAIVSKPIDAVAEADDAGPIAAEANPQIFATMCALVASGFETGPVKDPEFARLQARLIALHGPATEAMRDYYRQHAFTDPSETLSRFVTFALVAGPAPNFKPDLRQDQLPPDVASLAGFSQVLANFYQEAQIEQVWRQLQPVYEHDAANMREPLAQIVFASTGYLREIIHPGVRKFRVYVEPMVGGETNVRNIGDTYVVVVNPASPAVDLMRHAFLHFLLDPLPIRYQDKLLPEEPLLVIADRAANLPGEYRADMTSFFTECFVRAVEYRVRRLPPAQLTEKVNSSEADGFVLVRPLIKALSKFESSEPAMSLYFPDLLRSIDVVAEQQRLKTVAFAPESDAAPSEDPDKRVRPDKQNGPQPTSELDTELTSAERMIADRDPASAARVFERVLQEHPGQPRALYGLAIASVLQGDADRARSLFQQVLNTANAGSPDLRADPTTLGWSHIYLGRMYDLAGDREQAVNEYRAASAVDGAVEAVRSAAESGLQQAYRPGVGNSSPH